MLLPPVIHREPVQKDWLDYNGHMNVAYYVLIFDHATDAFLEMVGLNETYRAATDGSVFVVESHITYEQEVLADSVVEVSTHLLNYDSKRLHLFHTMHPEGSDDTLATIEIMLLHVNLISRRTTAFPETIKSRFQTLADQHSGFSHPEKAGRQVTFRNNR